MLGQKFCFCSIVFIGLCWPVFIWTVTSKACMWCTVSKLVVVVSNNIHHGRELWSCTVLQCRTIVLYCRSREEAVSSQWRVISAAYSHGSSSVDSLAQIFVWRRLVVGLPPSSASTLPSLSFAALPGLSLLHSRPLRSLSLYSYCLALPLTHSFFLSLCLNSVFIMPFLPDILFVFLNRSPCQVVMVTLLMCVCVCVCSIPPLR